MIRLQMTFTECQNGNIVGDDFMMCPHCNKENENTSSVCEFCNQNINPETPKTPPMKIDNTSPKKKKTGRIIACVVSIIVVVSIAVGIAINEGLLYWIKGNIVVSNEQTSVPTTKSQPMPYGEAFEKMKNYVFTEGDFSGNLYSVILSSAPQETIELTSDGENLCLARTVEMVDGSIELVVETAIVITAEENEMLSVLYEYSGYSSGSWILKQTYTAYIEKNNFTYDNNTIIKGVRMDSDVQTAPYETEFSDDDAQTIGTDCAILLSSSFSYLQQEIGVSCEDIGIKM